MPPSKGELRGIAEADVITEGERLAARQQLVEADASQP
jgi:hypothetical protein